MENCCFSASLNLFSSVFCGSDCVSSIKHRKLWSVTYCLACVIQLWLVYCEISKSKCDQSDVIKCRNPYTSVKLWDNLMPCMLKWSKHIYFCVIWKSLLNGMLASNRNTFSMAVNCTLNFWKTESRQKWQGHVSQVGFIPTKIVFTTTICHPM